MTSKISSRLVFLAITVVGLVCALAMSALAHAAGVAPDPGDNASGFFQAVLDGIHGRHWWMLASTVAVGVTWLLRWSITRYSSSWSALAWFTTDRGGVALTALVAMLGGFATAAGAGVAPGWDTLLDMLKIFLAAIGQYVAIKKVVKPADKAGAAAA